ncbi:MAG: hypothetical protein AAFX02_11085 [Pseudomonadota bacterium]
MRISITIGLLFALAVGGCSDPARDPVTFSCQSSNEGQPEAADRVVFHFEDGFLFLQNDEGGADNVCTQDGTTSCAVKMTRTSLSVRQAVSAPYCGFRTEMRTTLDIDRKTGKFMLTQQACDPKKDLVIKATCSLLGAS